MKKKIIVIFVIVLLIIVSSILILINCKNSKNDNINNVIGNDKISITKEEINFQMQKENISEQDRKKEENIKKATDEILERKIIDKECEKRNIQLDNIQEEELKNKAFVEDLSEEDMEYAKKTGMTEEEMRQAIYELSTEMQKEVKLYDALLKEIYNNEITIDNQEFQSKVDKYNKNKDSKNVDSNYNVIELKKLADEYFELIKNQYTIDS